MTKLAIAFALAALATPALACPNMDHDAAPQTPKTAEKAKDPKASEPAKAKDADQPKDQKPADTAKTKDTAKKPDKVSSK